MPELRARGTGILPVRATLECREPRFPVFSRTKHGLEARATGKVEFPDGLRRISAHRYSISLPASFLLLRRLVRDLDFFDLRAFQHLIQRLLLAHLQEGVAQESKERCETSEILAMARG